MRIVAWNCNMALERKIDRLLELEPDIAVVPECAEPGRLRARSSSSWMEGEPIWIGRNPHKGLAVFAFNGYRVQLDSAYHPSLRYIAPVRVSGPASCNLLAVWAQEGSAGGVRKNRSGPLRRGLKRYKSFLGEGPAAIAGDLNSNTIWDKPGWRNNHTAKVEILAGMGMVSAYHAIRGENHGQETEPTLYWRDRSKDGPTYHIDYVFLPIPWIDRVSHLSVGAFDKWCGSGLSDHAPVIVDVDI